MSVFIIQEIHATPNLTTRRPDGYLSNANEDQVIWSWTGNWKDGTDGSTRPVSWLIPQTQNDEYQIPLSIQGGCLLRKEYAAAKYAVHGYALDKGNKRVSLFRSQEWVAPTFIPDSGEMVKLEPATMMMQAPLKKMVCPIPFRWSGTFIFVIQSPGKPDILGPEANLELCFASSSAPKGPIHVKSRLLRTDVNLEQIWPIHLFRFFLTSPLDFPSDQILLTEDLRKYWLNHVMRRVWDWGNPHNSDKPQYDTVTGRAAYVSGGGGGTFDLCAWMVSKRKKLACQDLAAISQLGCTLLRDARDGSEVLLSNWVYQIPNGFILPGQLYGWYGVGKVGLCNNPFFGRPSHPEPLVEIGNRTDRFAFDTHVWLEADYNTAHLRGVLDATCIVKDSSGVYVPDNGSRSRPQWSTAHIDAAAYQPPPDPKDPNARPGNLDDCLSFVSGSTGDCHTNNADTGQGSTGPDDIRRVGVTGVGVVVAPILTPSSLPRGLLSDIEQVIAAGTNPQQPRRAFSNGPFHRDALIEALSHIDGLRTASSSSSTHVDQDIVLQKLECLITTRDGKGNSNDFELSITVHTSCEAALQSLIRELTLYDMKLTDVVSAIDPPVGVVSLQTETSIFFTRANLFVHLSLPNLTVPASNVEKQILHAAARAMDQHVASSETEPGSHRHLDTSSPLLDDATKPLAVIKGRRFTVSLPVDQLPLTTATTAMSSDCSVVIPQGGMDAATGKLEFYAANEGEAEITILTAHVENLFPASLNLTVHVRANEGASH